MNAVNTMFASIPLLFLMLAVSVGAQVCLGLAAFNDAKAEMVDNPAMWGCLVGFLGLIPGIIYLVTRNNARNKLMPCPNCGWLNPMYMPVCTRCNAPSPYAGNAFAPQTMALERKAKMLLIWGIVLYVSAIVISIIAVGVFMVGAADAATRYWYY